MTRLWLHVGTHKTGTTAIQAYLAQCRTELAAQGILYPSLRPGLWKERESHHKVAQALARYSVIDRFRLGRYRRWIDRSRPRVTILSAEPIYRHVVGKAEPRDLDEWFSAHRRYLRRLATWLSGFDVQPLVYFRPPDDFAVSLYKEHVVRRLLRGNDRGFEGFLAMSAPFYEYCRHQATLAEVFGTVVARDYADACRHGLLADFTALVGARDLPPPSRAEVRCSPGNRATLWLARQPERGTRRSHVRRVLFALRAGREGPFGEREPTTLWPDRASFERFVERHRSAWDLRFLPAPAWNGLPSATWTADDHAAAESAFRAWEASNIDLLRRREARGLAFYEPDPGA